MSIQNHLNTNGRVLVKTQMTSKQEKFAYVLINQKTTRAFRFQKGTEYLLLDTANYVNGTKHPHVSLITKQEATKTIGWLKDAKSLNAVYHIDTQEFLNYLKARA